MYSVGVLGLICFILTAYFSGIRERQERMQETITVLKNTSTKFIEDKFKNLDFSYTSQRLGGRSERTTRVCVSEKGRYEVKIDSLKESRGLYDLVDVGGKFECLMLEHLFSLDEMFAAWKNETEKLGYTMSCALKLTVSDMHSLERLIFVAGNSTLYGCLLFDGTASVRKATFVCDMYQMGLMFVSSASRFFNFACVISFGD